MNVLAVGAHPDDIELGCGGALLAHRKAGHRVTMLVMTGGELGPTGNATRRAEQEDAAALLGAELRWGRFEDGLVPGDLTGVVAVEAALSASGADIVYTHTTADTHQDHRATASATLAAARRSCRILSYESPSTVGFAPTLHIDVADFVEGKLDLVRAHMSQVLGCGLVDPEAIEAQARFRGFQARARYAEAFEAHRFVWSPLDPGLSVAPSHQVEESQEAPAWLR